MSKWIFVDVEATGRSPINGKMTEFGAVDRKTRQTFHGVIWEATPDPNNPAVSVMTGKLIKPLSDVMHDFVAWLESLGKDRPIFVSDNPAYDYQWINAAFDECGLNNPFGHSARRISDFWAGLQRNWGDTQTWKQFRQTPHDHNPVNDAMGNVEAFEHIMRLVMDESEFIDHGRMPREEFEKIRPLKVAQYRRQAHNFIDSIETPFVIVASRPVRHKKGNMRVDGVVALAGEEREAAILLASLYSMRQTFLNEMARDLSEDEMNVLLELDESLLREALHGRA